MTIEGILVDTTAPDAGIVVAPWLPCGWCGWMPTGCTCAPISKKQWERQLEQSEAARERDRRAAEWRLLRDTWGAA